MKSKTRNLLRRAAMLCVLAVTGLAGAADVGFTTPYDDWRTSLQLSAATTKATFYEPVSVITTQETMMVSFGWTAKGASVSLPPVRFAVVDVNHRKVVEWVEPAGSFVSQSCSPEKPNNVWSGGYACEVLKFLDPGDYRLEAEIDPDNTQGESVAARADNTTFFRFAVRDTSLTFGDVFTGTAWKDLTTVKGNDFAQEPFPSVRGVTIGSTTLAAAQFGPYVPMNGKAVSSRKKPLDLVFVIDATGSMSGCIKGLLQNISVFIDQLFKGDASKGIDPIDDLRIKLVSFGDDYGDRNSSYGWYQESAFSSDLSYLKSVLGNSRFFGGYNGCYNGAESAFDALWYVVHEWVPDTSRGCYQKKYVTTPNPFRQVGEAARAVILFSDEPAWAPKGSGFNKYPEMTAIGCYGKTTAQLAQAVKDAHVDLTVVTDNVLRGWKWGFTQYSDLIAAVGKPTTGEDAGYIHNVSTLSQFTQSGESLRKLANSISASVPTVVVEPTLKVSTSEMGTLSFKWKNDTTAGTNNIFRFVCRDSGVTTTNATCTASNDWEFVSLPFTSDGLHTFEWTYRKIGYEGDVADCGLISDVQWTPSATQLKIDPESAEYAFDAAPSNLITVTCNQAWEVAVEPGASWVHLDRLPATGNGNGSFTYSIDENATYKTRTATITVTAGKNNGTIVTRTHTIVQKPSPYQENGEIQLIDVGIKPRWPWNSLVDIDFRVIAPAKGTGTPVRLDVKGIDCQAETFGFRKGSYYVTDCVTNVPTFASKMVVEAFCRHVEIAYESKGNAYFTCPSSGVYRITLDLGKWQTAMWTDVNKFHTPKFRVLFDAQATHGGATKKFHYLADPVRVDTRVGVYGTGGYDQSGKLIRRNEQCGGVVITGTEKVGHPDGDLDPFDWDSTQVQDGRHDLTSLFAKDFQVDVMTNLPVVVLNNVKIEGGMIDNGTNTVWAANVVHLVRDNVFVCDGSSLTIEDGAVVKFCDNTAVYVHYGSNYDSLNLVVKGAYICNAYDPTVGGDTLYEPTTTNLFLNSSAYGAYGVFHDYEFKGDSSRNSSDLYAQYGIRSIPLYVPDAQGRYSDVPRWVRSYTRRQSVGETLPRPSGAGKSFVGWYRTQPTSGSTPVNLANYKVSADYTVLTSGTNFKTESLYALSASPSDPTWGQYTTKTMADPVEITLAYDEAFFNGSVQKPAVTRVKVGETEIDPANYTVSYSDPNSKQVGVYTATVNFLQDYTNSPSATYAIRSVSGESAEVSLSPTYRTYTGKVLAKPTVTVRINSRTLVAGTDYDVGWSAGDWLSVGTYRATVELKGNYYGTVQSDLFEIRENPNLAVVFYDSDAAAQTRLGQMTGSPRVLYVTGNTTGSDRVATCGIIDLLKNDPLIRPFVLTNFVCRYDDYATVGSNRCATTYAPTFAGRSLPFIGVVSEKDLNKCLVSTNGYLSATDLMAFLVRGLATQEDVLPELVNPTDSEVRELIAGVAWADPAIVASVTNAATYAMFRAWTLRLAAQTPPVDIQTVIASPRAYLSSRLSAIMQSPVLLSTTDKVELKVADFTVGSGTPPTCEVVVELKVGNPPVSVQLQAAAEALADIVWLGGGLTSFRKANVSDVKTAVLNGNKVKLSVTMPSGDAGFMKMIVK